MNQYPVGNIVQVKSADSTAAGFLSYATGSAVLTDPLNVNLVVTINEGAPIVFTCTVNITITGQTTTVSSGTWPLQSTFPVQISRTSVGLYTANLATSNMLTGASLVQLPGEWIYEWQGTSPGQGTAGITAVKPNSFYVTTYPN